ncbi:MAG: hypothetical protein H6719_13595 [Sandaracinaceae bacterium]|nr:hypothetical protein [Sandaracinaceae bacterium]
MRPRTLGALGVALATLALAAWSLPLSTASAGACAQFGTLGAELVDPGGAIPLGPDAGPLLRVVLGERRVDRSQMARFADPFRGLRVAGPGSPSVRRRQVAPGVHRVVGAFRAGTYRVTGIQGGGRVRFDHSTPAPLPAPGLTSARVATSEVPRDPRRGGGTTTFRTLTVTVSPASPPGAAWLLVYQGPATPERTALHAAPTQPGATTFSFTQGRTGGRCGPSLPSGGVPNPDSELTAVWLGPDGRVSSSSAAIIATAP